jgi:selenocysteine lyase/cysteine desulfurase
MDPFLPDDQKVAAIRTLLPATSAGIFLDAPTAGPLPAETDRALREADDWELRVGRGGPDHAADAALRRDEASGVLAAVLGLPPDRVLPVMGVRAAMAAVIAAIDVPGRALALAPGLEPGVAAAARMAALARGWLVTQASEVPGGVTVAPAVRVDDGSRPDLDVLADRAASTGGRLVVDLTHAAGALDLARTPTDLAILATDRWLLGPDGTAAIVADARTASTVRELVDPLPRRAALGLARSVGWLLMYVGLPWAVARTAAAADHLRSALAAIPGVAVRGDPLETGGSPVLAVTIDGWTADQAADELGRRVFAITGRTPDGAAIRVGVGAWSTDAELDRFAAAVMELARHTPDTLPRKPAITVLGGG